MRLTACKKAIDQLVSDNKLTREDGMLVNKKAKKVIETQHELNTKQASNARSRWQKDDKKSNKNNVTNMPPHETGTTKNMPTRNQIPDTRKKEKNTKKKTPSLEEEFEIWYSAYPTHVGRGQALRAYRTARTKASGEVLLAGVQKYRENKPSYAAWAQPATWLNGERWLDDPDPDAPKAKEFPPDWKPKILISEWVGERDAASWTAVMEDLATKIGPGEFESWLGKLMLLSVAGDDVAKTFHATAPTAFIRDTAQQRYTKTLQDMLMEKAGAPSWFEIAVKRAEKAMGCPTLKKTGGGSPKTNNGTTSAPQADLARSGQ